uniref:hypothetical protein n=1 Tax=Sinorhizobium chiapasense TaxID=501572 RepID=UPI002FE35E0A
MTDQSKSRCIGLKLSSQIEIGSAPADNCYAKPAKVERDAQVFAANGIGAPALTMAALVKVKASPGMRSIPSVRDAGTRMQQRLSSLSKALVQIEWDMGHKRQRGHVLVVAAEDRRVKAVVSQGPTISGSKVAVRRAKTQVALLREQLATDRVLRVLGQGRSYVDVVAEHSEQACALPEQDSSEYFKTASVIAPNWNPQITVRSLELARANEPGAFVRLISPMPLLMLVA